MLELALVRSPRYWNEVPARNDIRLARISKCSTWSFQTRWDQIFSVGSGRRNENGTQAKSSGDWASWHLDQVHSGTHRGKVPSNIAKFTKSKVLRLFAGFFASFTGVLAKERDFSTRFWQFLWLTTLQTIAGNRLRLATWLKTTKNLGKSTFCKKTPQSFK